ncbi:MAG TPA: rRNA adenine N-6-methyltransferase family protein [Sphingobacterium sp.]|nr:rRNA adenine N-6-methyltransferase family protein [Sphingobacterium sp.]
MKKNKLPVRFTGQHFTIDNILIQQTIQLAQIHRKDIVLDIGAGKGFLTAPLALKCQKVIAIEYDQFLVKKLKAKFAKYNRVCVIENDFRYFPRMKMPFKVVSNIPYRITAYILKYLMYEHIEFFKGGTLIMQLEPARKLISKSVFNPYIIFYRTFFNLTFIQQVLPESFIPPPTVQSALLKIEEQKCIIHFSMKKKYLAFLFLMLKRPDISIKTTLKQVFRKRQAREVCRKHRIEENLIVTKITARQWVCCFLEMMDKVPKRYHPKIEKDK